MTEPTEPRADPAPALPNQVGPTFQTAASEAADEMAKAVARQVAATAAANEAAAKAAAEAAAAREAEEERLAAEARAAEEARAADEAAAAEANAASAAANAASAAAMATEASLAAPADASMATANPLAAVPVQTIGVPAVAEAPSAPAAEAPATPKPARRLIILAWTRRLAVFVLSVALLLGGIVLGWATFQRNHVVPADGGAIEFTQPPPDVAKEFITALAASDANAIRSSLSAQTNKDLTDEFTKFAIKNVTSVDTLGTSVDGARSATEVLLHTVNTDGNKFDINLIILVNGNTIEGFR